MNNEFIEEVEKRKQEAEEASEQFNDFCKELFLDLTRVYNKIDKQMLKLNCRIKEENAQEAKMEFLIRIRERIQEAEELMDICTRL